MSNVVDLKPAHLEDDDELIENLARYADGTLSEGQVKARHRLSNEAWAAMGESDRLVELVEAAKLRRIRTGATKRERAQIEIVDGPVILWPSLREPPMSKNTRDYAKFKKRPGFAAGGPIPDATMAAPLTPDASMAARLTPDRTMAATLIPDRTMGGSNLPGAPPSAAKLRERGHLRGSLRAGRDRP